MVIVQALVGEPQTTVPVLLTMLWYPMIVDSLCRDHWWPVSVTKVWKELMLIKDLFLLLLPISYIMDQISLREFADTCSTAFSNLVISFVLWKVQL